MHEQSETIQDKLGRWVNVFGRGTGNAGSRLPGMPDYATVGAADAAAAARSKAFRSEPDALGIQRYWERSYTPPVQENSMPGGLSSYQYQGLSPRPEDAVDPRSRSLASVRDPLYSTYGRTERPRPDEQPTYEAGAQPQNMDTMLSQLDSGQLAPGTLGQTREAMPPQPQQGNNQWLQWLMQYLQSKGAPQGGVR